MMKDPNSVGNSQGQQKTPNQWDMSDVSEADTQINAHNKQEFQADAPMSEQERAAKLKSLKSNMITNAVENKTGNMRAQGQSPTCGDILNTAIEAQKQYEQGNSVYVPDSVAKQIGYADHARGDKLQGKRDRLQRDSDELRKEKIEGEQNKEYKGLLGQLRLRKINAQLRKNNAQIRQIDNQISGRLVGKTPTVQEAIHHGREEANNLYKIQERMKALGRTKEGRRYQKIIKRAEKRMGAKLPKDYHNSKGMRDWSPDALETLANQG